MYTVGNGTNGIQLVPHTPEYCIQLFRVVPKGSVVPCAARAVTSSTSCSEAILKAQRLQLDPES